MMKRRNFNLIKTGRKNKLALAVGLALAMSAMGSVYASGNDDTFKNFANGEKLLANAANWRTYREFLNSTGLQAIGADKAYALGYSGAGITLGIVDTGVRADHEEFDGKVDLINKTVNDWADKETWHGSHVAGIMLSKKDGIDRKNNMMGVAFAANLKSIDYGLNERKRIELAKKYIESLGTETKIINNSWGGMKSGSWKKFVHDDVINNDRVYVFAAGNNGNADLSDYIPADLASDSVIADNFINVVNIDDINNISVDSNIAKGAHKNTVCAVGSNVNSVLANSLLDYTEKSGTSMAAPYVSGTLGLVQEANPYLSGKQLVDVVLSTANQNFEHPKFALTLKNHEENNRVIIDEVNLICIDYNDKNNDISKDLKEWFSANSKSNWSAFLGNYLIDTYKYNSLFAEIDNLILQNVDWETCYYNIEALKADNVIFKNEKARRILAEIEKLYIAKDVDELKKQSNNLRDLLVDLRAEEATRKLLSGIEKQKNFYKKYNYTFEEVYGQGIVDAGKAVQGLGAIDVERLDNSSLISDAYNGSKDYMYIVDTGEKEENFKQRGYSIWSNDIAEKNTNGKKAGIAKSGDVDLILLGNNTYTGHTLVTGGKLQIVRGVNGNVIADGENGEAIAEINGYAKNVYAYNGGKIFITDKIARKSIDESGAEFYNAALPENTIVSVNGCITAKDWVKQNSNSVDDKIEGGSIVDIKLNNVGSTITGALYKGKNSILNVSLASGSKLNVIGSRDSIFQEKTGNNVLSSLNFNSGIVDFTNDTRYVNFKINKLSGNDGLFLLKTDLQSRKADYIIVDAAEGDQQHSIGIIDKNGIVENNGAYVKISETPNNVSLREFVLPVDTGVYQYKPLIDSLPDSSERKGWYFYGFGDGKLARPEINGLADGEEHYTTDTILNNGLKSFNSTINVSQGTSNAMKINMTKDDNDRVTGVYGSVDFTGNGAIDISVSDDGSYYKHLIGLGVDKDYTDKNDTYKFSSEADVSKNINNKKSSNSYGIVNEKNDGIVDINGNTKIVINDIDNRSYGLRNSGQLDIGKDLSITMNASKVFTENDKYNGSYSVYTGIESNNKMRIGGDTNIKLSRGVGVPQIIRINKGEAIFDGNVKIEVDGEQTKYSGGVIGGFLGLNVGGYYRDDIDYAATKIKGDLNIELNNFMIGSVDSPKAIYISEKGQLDVSGDIRVVVSPADVDNKSHNGYIYNFGTTKAANISTENCDLQNGGVLVVTENIMVDELDNINANGDSQLYADKIKVL